MIPMFEADALEFPFVAGMPKREKSRLAKCWDMLKRMNALQATEGSMIPLIMAAKCLGVSRTRIDQLIQEGRLNRFEIDGHVFVSENSMVEFAKLERKWGRPVKVPTTNSEIWKAALETGREVAAEVRAKKLQKSC